MKMFLFSSAVALMCALAIGCQKKDDGPAAPAGPPACPAGQVFSQNWGGCLPTGQCTQGLVQNPTQRSMCANPINGQNIMTQQCGTGYVLTVNGCLPPCPNRAGWGMADNACLEGINVGAYQQQQMMSQQPAYQQQYYNQMPYGQMYYPQYYRY